MIEQVFGYIRISKPELRIKEYEMYKAVYCSLCKVMGKSYGIWSRFTLSYDFTFLALINMSIKNGCDPVEKGRCTCNPLKKCIYCKSDEHLQMPAAAAMIMMYYKLLDNIEDEKGIKKLGCLTLKPLFSSANKKAAKKYPEIEKIISNYILVQDKLEAANTKGLDEAADPTAIALAEILKLCSDDATEKRILERIGYCLGRYIYILDAACDLEEDIKNNRYNCLKYSLNDNINEFIKEKIVPQLFLSLNEAGSAFELLDVKKYRAILGNIIYLGLEDTFKKELKL